MAGIHQLWTLDPLTGTLAIGLSEPSGATLLGVELVVVESGAHRVTRLRY